MSHIPDAEKVASALIGQGWAEVAKEMPEYREFVTAMGCNLTDPALATPSNAHADNSLQPEDSRRPPTYRREEAVKALIGMGWAWDGKQWKPSADSGRVGDDERQWRELLAIRVAGPMLYTDDGELSDATAEPYIDFLRDSADTIARKLADRSRAALAAQGQGEAIGYITADNLALLKRDDGSAFGHMTAPIYSRARSDREVPIYTRPTPAASPAGVPTEVTAWVDAKREHKRLVEVYNARLAYSKQHDLGHISVDHEYQAMCAQQRVMNGLIEPMFTALAAAPSAKPEGAGGAG